MNEHDDQPIPFPGARLSKAVHDLKHGNRSATGSDPSLKVSNDREACDHHMDTYFEIDAKERIIVCSKCSAQIDPFDALLIIARSESRMQREYEEIQKEKRARRGFYQQKRTVQAQRCRHTQTHDLPNGMKKCYRCDQVFEPKVLKAQATEGQGDD